MLLFWTVVMFVVIYALAYSFAHKDSPGVVRVIILLVWLGVMSVYTHYFLFIPTIVSVLEFLGRVVGFVFFALVPLVLGFQNAPFDVEPEGDDEESETSMG